MLRIYVWACVFVFLGVVSSKYLIAENNTKILFLITFMGAIINITLNSKLIPKFGINGAAIATVLSQFAVVFSIVFISKTRYNFLSIFYFFQNLEAEEKSLGKP